MSTNHNRIKVADLEINQPNKILTTNALGELEFSNINDIKTDSYNALDYSIAGKALDARQGKILKDLIDNINALLASDNVNLDTVQELVDAIETVQISLSTILVNDLSTGGTTKALTAEMGKTLKGLVDALTNVVSGKQNTLAFSTDIEADKTSTTKVLAIKTLYDWAVAKFVQITNIKTVNGNSLIGTGNITTPDMDTTTAQNVSGVKTFLAGMFGLRNTANTFTSFFASAVTASRTWMWPDKSGTVAMTSDIVAQLSGTVNRLVKFGTSTTGTNSRIIDDGTYLGIGTVNPSTKDIALGAQANRVFGIEQSDSNNLGKDLTIEAGRTINYALNTGFVSLNTGQLTFFGITVTPSLDVYVSRFQGGIFKRSSGSTNFVDLSQTSRDWQDIAAAPNGNVYAVVGSGDIYMQTAGTGNFVALNQTSRAWFGIAAAPNGDIYATVNGGDIYKRTAGTGNFIALSQISRAWQHITVAPNGNVYATVNGGDIYMQTAGTGNFVGLSQTLRTWYGIAAAPNGNVYAVEAAATIYMQTAGTGNFVNQNFSNNWRCIAAAPNGDMYASGNFLDIYYQ